MSSEYIRVQHKIVLKDILNIQRRGDIRPISEEKTKVLEHLLVVMVGVCQPQAPDSIGRGSNHIMSPDVLGKAQLNSEIHS